MRAWLGEGMMRGIGDGLGRDGRAGEHVARVMQWGEEGGWSKVNFGGEDREAVELKIIEHRASQDRTIQIISTRDRWSHLRMAPRERRLKEWIQVGGKRQRRSKFRERLGAWCATRTRSRRGEEEATPSAV